MNFRTNDLNRPRRIFLGVVLALALVLGWILSKPWRTGVQEHKLGGASVFTKIVGSSWTMNLGTNQLLWWTHGENGIGEFYVDTPVMMWHFRACTKTNLLAVTPDDAHGAYYGYSNEGQKMFGENWRTNHLVVRDGQILLVRHSSDTQTVYAVEVTEQRDNTGYFRTRKILPAPERR